MAKTWEVSYMEHQIKVENSWFNGERLFVDNVLQDEQVGMASRCRLYGHLINESGETERIKVSLGGWFSICCRIFVNDSLVLTDNKYI